VKAVWITANKRIRGLVPIHQDCRRHRDEVNGSNVTYVGDVADIKQPSWQQWNIDLALFGVDLRNIKRLAIAFSDEINLAPGGLGVVYFDDIGLYPLREPEGSVTGN
jgi:hypothetical protein